MAQIAVDIDSTLYDFEEVAREAFLKLAGERDEPSLRRGAYDPWPQWRSAADSCGMAVWLDVVKLVHDSDVILSRRPFPGAVETCWGLFEGGHELLYISNRATEAESATREWLLNNDFPMSPPNELVTTTESKALHLSGCQYLIDDRPQTVLDFVYDPLWTHSMHAERTYMWESGDGVPFEFYQPAMNGQYENAMRDFIDWHDEQNRRRAYMIMWPHNQNLTDCHDVYLAPTWAGLNSYMVKHGLLAEPCYTALA